MSETENSDSDDLDHIELVERNTFKSTMLNEAILLSRLITKIKLDAHSLISFLLHCTPHMASAELQATRTRIENNAIPESWRKLGFKITTESLSDFMETLFIKIAYLSTFLWSNPKPTVLLELPHIVHLDKLLDPASFLGAYLYN